MSKVSFTNGTPLKELINANPNDRTWLLNFRGTKVKGVEIKGHKIYFPKENQTELAKVDKATLGAMVLNGVEDEPKMFFLRQATATVGDW